MLLVFNFDYERQKVRLQLPWLGSLKKDSEKFRFLARVSISFLRSGRIWKTLRRRPSRCNWGRTRLWIERDRCYILEDPISQTDHATKVFSLLNRLRSRYSKPGLSSPVIYVNLLYFFLIDFYSNHNILPLRATVLNSRQLARRIRKIRSNSRI